MYVVQDILKMNSVQKKHLCRLFVSIISICTINQVSMNIPKWNEIAIEQNIGDSCVTHIKIDFYTILKEERSIERIGIKTRDTCNSEQEQK